MSGMLAAVHNPRSAAVLGGPRCPCSPTGSTVTARTPLPTARRCWPCSPISRRTSRRPGAVAAQKYVERHRKRGKLLPRERIELLVDQDAPFLELSPLAAYGTTFPVGASVVTGIGVVEGVECLLIANDPTVRGGATNPVTAKKVGRAMEIARQNRLPLINLVESGGADLPTQAEIFIPGGGMFRNLTKLSAARIPTIALVFGNSTAGGAYVPGMCDHVVMVKERAKVFLGGPPLVKMATGEDSDDESLGGAEMHARTSGLADYLAEDEVDAHPHRPAIVSRLNWRKLGPGPSQPADPPLYDEERAAGHPVDRPAGAVRPARRARPRRRRHRASTSSSRSTAAPWSRAGRASTASRSASWPTPAACSSRGVAEGGAVHPAGQQRRHAAGLPAEHHRLHGRQGLRAARHHQGRRQDDQRRQQQHRPAPHRDPRCVVRRRATTACAAGPTARASCSPGPTRSRPSWVRRSSPG